MTINLNIEINDICFFEKNKLKDNDVYAKKRESIIYKILKNEIPSWFFNDSRWLHLKENLFKVFFEFNPFTVIKGGGWLSYDFLLINNATVTQVDFKYNIKNIKNYPQIIDLKSSKLGFFCYAVYYYYYCEIKNISLENYLKYIWRYDAHTKSSFFFNLKNLYKTNSVFKKKWKFDTFNSIKTYIKIVDLDIIELNSILININKLYLLYYEGNWLLDKSMLNRNTRIFFELGRWKNNTGVLVPIWKLKYIKKLPKGLWYR